MHCVFCGKMLFSQNETTKKDFHTCSKRQRAKIKPNQNRNEEKEKKKSFYIVQRSFIGLSTLFPVRMAFIVINIDTHVDIFSFWCRSPSAELKSDTSVRLRCQNVQRTPINQQSHFGSFTAFHSKLKTYHCWLTNSCMSCY